MPAPDRHATMWRVTHPAPDPLGLLAVRDAYDTVAADYARRLPDTRAEAALDLAMVDAFAEAVTSDDDPRVLDAGCGTGRMSRYLADRGCLVEGSTCRPEWSPWPDATNPTSSSRWAR